MTRCLALLVVAALLVGCGGDDPAAGTATLWVTRDRGAKVLLTATVPAGLTAMQALQREANVETRYGGRFVHAIDGLAGSVTRRRDWFYFLNGYESDRGAAEYRLHRGDVEWWDYRSWARQPSVPVVVGAFPEPFLHGYAGKRRPAVVAYSKREHAGAARRLARLVRGSAVRGVVRDPRVNVVSLRLARSGEPTGLAAAFRHSRDPGAPVVFRVTGDPMRLARDARLASYRYELAP